ncbi:MAG: DUF2244 domain-containing protein [Gammaproteobacteria bacterium]
MGSGANNNSLSTFVVTPNCSMTWQENKIFVASLAVVSFSIAGGFALHGLWLILPFAGLEMMMLTGILYWSSLRATRCEVISIDADNISVEVGRNKMRHVHSFQRAWTRVEVRPAARPHWQSRLVMRSKGKELEIGACLNDEERQSLAASINKALLPSV